MRSSKDYSRSNRNCQLIRSAGAPNLIHTPQQPGYEAAVVDLFLREEVRRVSASAYMRLSPEVVRYTALGLERRHDGQIIRTNHVFAKVSRAEVAEQFLTPAPDAILNSLVDSGAISSAQAELARQVPVAAEITAEADSGGHTDRRSAAPLFSSISAARDRVASKSGIDPNAIRIGLAGGIATPHAVAAAFGMGAAYVLTGSINQAAVESGLSLPGRQLLAKAGPADVAMAPAADMFEQGVEVQVLKRGTLFAMRGKKTVSALSFRRVIRNAGSERPVLDRRCSWRAVRGRLASDTQLHQGSEPERS
jgi:trans-AT polyketide synthase/acyltransferase/oxidoreductase domain-containing protein